MVKKDDLSGKTFGAIDVIKRTGIDNGGNALYLCKCNLCGKEKEFPATTIRKNPKGCGCQEYSTAKMKKISEKGVEKIFKDDTNVTQLFSKKAMVNSKTKVRGVCVFRGKFRASVQVAKERVTKDFDTMEEAILFRAEMHEKLVKKYGLEKYKK